VSTRDTAPAAAWRQCLPDMRDVWRAQHPQRSAFTYFYAGGGVSHRSHSCQPQPTAASGFVQTCR
jgi:hypothetical protein